MLTETVSTSDHSNSSFYFFYNCCHSFHTHTHTYIYGLYIYNVHLYINGIYTYTIYVNCIVYHGIQSRHFMTDGETMESDRPYFLGLQNHCSW